MSDADTVFLEVLKSFFKALKEKGMDRDQATIAVLEIESNDDINIVLKARKEIYGS